jgi:hypothetical protein
MDFHQFRPYLGCVPFMVSPGLYFGRCRKPRPTKCSCGPGRSACDIGPPATTDVYSSVDTKTVLMVVKRNTNAQWDPLRSMLTWAAWARSHHGSSRSSMKCVCVCVCVCVRMRACVCACLQSMPSLCETFASFFKFWPCVSYGSRLSASNTLPWFAQQGVITQVKNTLALERDDPAKVDSVAALRKQTNDWVAKYRRDTSFAGRPSYGYDT